MAKSGALVPADDVARAIHVIRGKRVMLDADLARTYGVETKSLNRAVKRNHHRFPPDFMFRLTADEARALRYHLGTSNEPGRGGRRHLPYAFTEHGAVMLASVLNSPTAVDASIMVVRAFVRLRGMLAEHQELARKLDDLERKYDTQFRVVFDAIRHLMDPAGSPERKRIGFQSRSPGGGQGTHESPTAP